MLAGLGYKFDSSNLEQWEVEAYKIIANTIHEEQVKDSKRKK